MFPTLLNGGAQSVLSNKKASTDLNQTMEVMMMKRMNYIRNNLDLSNPREQTSKIRLEATKKRDERILELWKKDSEYPKIGDLIANLKNEKSRIQRNDFVEVSNQLDVPLESEDLEQAQLSYQLNQVHDLSH